MTKLIWKIYSVSNLVLAVGLLLWPPEDFGPIAAARTVCASFAFFLVYCYAFDVRWRGFLSKKKTCFVLIGFILVDLLWSFVDLYNVVHLGMPIFLVSIMLSVLAYFNFIAIYRYGLASDEIERHASHKPKSL